MTTMYRYQLPVDETGAIEFADVDSEGMLENDNRVAEQFDARRFVRDVLS